MSDTIKTLLIALVGLVGVGVIAYIIFIGFLLTGAWPYASYLLRIGSYKIDERSIPVLKYTFLDKDDPQVIHARVKIEQDNSDKLVSWFGYVRVNGVEIKSNYGSNYASVDYRGYIPRANKYEIQVLYSNKSSILHEIVTNDKVRIKAELKKEIDKRNK